MLVLSTMYCWIVCRARRVYRQSPIFRISLCVARSCDSTTVVACSWFPFFFFNDTAPTEIYTLSLHDALPICIRCVHRNLRHQVREGRRVPDKRPRATARLLRLPRRALETSTHDKPDREHVRDRSASNGSIERLPLEQDRPRHDLQARTGRREKLASSPRSRPVAESHPRCKVQRRNRGRQIASSSRCRLTSLVTKIRR